MKLRPRLPPPGKVQEAISRSDLMKVQNKVSETISDKDKMYRTTAPE
jgi:hypothetical protein